MATPNASDNTQLGTGELISNEQIEVIVPKGDSNQPVTAYKVPRSKIAVGPYGQDLGDATQAQPLNVTSYLERRELELMGFEDGYVTLSGFSNSAAENLRGFSFDVRGQGLESRGRR